MADPKVEARDQQAVQFTDLREFINYLRENNRLETVNGADWDLEIGGITEVAVREELSSALLFDEIRDYPLGYRVLTNAVSSAFQWTTAAGFEPTSSKKEAIIARKNRSSVSDLIPPETVSTGPIFENILAGDAIDVTEFPAPIWHEEDGGRFIGTGDVVVTQNANDGRVNAGTYRVQVQSENEVSVYISPGKDGKINRDSYLDQDEPCPMAISLGHPVDVFLAVNERIPSNVSEFAYVGGRRGSGLKVVEGEVTGLPFPAYSEIVLEGYIHPDSEPVSEGPYGEWTGYYAGGEHEVLPMTIERIYHRDDPIIFAKPSLRPPSQIRGEIRVAAKLWSELENTGIPGIQAVNSMPFGPGWFEVISISQQYGGHSTQTGYHAASGPADAYHGRFTVIVDDDVDIFDLNEVMWTISSRCDPSRDIHILENCWSTSLDPTIPPKKRERGDLRNSRAIIDATRPYHWRDQFPKVNEISPELETEIKQEWSSLFESTDKGQ